MICGINIIQKNITLTHKKLLENKLDFGAGVDLRTGEEINAQLRKNKKLFNNPAEDSYTPMVWRLAHFRDLKIFIGWRFDQKKGSEIYHLKIQGSLHKYACNGDNSGLFTATDAEKAKDDLCKELFLNEDLAEITSLEIGVNLKVWFDVLKYFRENLLRYKSEFFRAMDKDKKTRKSIGWVAELSHYKIKLYAKSTNILRFEVRFEDMQELRDNYKIRCVADLNAGTIIKMGDKILSAKWSDVVGKGGLNTTKGYANKELSKKNIEILLRFSSQSYLIELDCLIEKAETKKEKGKLLKARFRGKENFKFLVDKYGDNCLKKIDEMIKERIEFEIQNCPFFGTSIVIQNKDSNINSLNNNNNTMTSTTPVKSTSTTSKKVFNKIKTKEKEERAESIWNNSMKALSEILKQLKEKTGQLE